MFLVLPKETGVVTEISISDGGKAAGAAVLRVAGRIGQRHFHVQTLEIRVTNANVTRIEIMVFEQVEESIGKHNIYDERIRFRLRLLLMDMGMNGYGGRLRRADVVRMRRTRSRVR